ncbi:MAG: tripartite tricarboxylate transporter substrate binding protein [Burkholderiales bacterium]|nr:tripartite tricarboxylate transporter substrate binding protein [Burkholderiales bacterium]
MITRRQILSASAAGAAALALPSLAQRAWPNQPITLVDPFPAGGTTDYFSRLLAERMGPLLGTQVLVDNKAGAGGLIGATYVAKAKPDGYTIGMASVSTLCAGPAVQPAAAMRYDPAKDFSYITKVATAPSLMVSSLKLQVRDFKELVALARAQPGRISIGVPGLGSAGHVLTEYLMKLADVKFLLVPYKSGGTMITDLISGQLDTLSTNLPELLPHVKNGTMRPLAVRDTRRLLALPDTPTYEELGLAAVSKPLWFGLVAPAGVPEPMLARIRAAAHKAMVDRSFVDRTLAVSASISPSSGAEFKTDAVALLATLREVVRSAGIKPD